jgi:hypothetical protein
MRFARSNEYNPDTAIRAQREDMISNAFYENKGKTDLSGLRSRLGLQLSRTGGALSTMQNRVTGSVKPKKNKRKRRRQGFPEQGKQQQRPQRRPPPPQQQQQQQPPPPRPKRTPPQPQRSDAYENARSHLNELDAIDRQYKTPQTFAGAGSGLLRSASLSGSGYNAVSRVKTLFTTPTDARNTPSIQPVATAKVDQTQKPTARNRIMSTVGKAKYEIPLFFGGKPVPKGSAKVSPNSGSAVGRRRVSGNRITPMKGRGPTRLNMGEDGPPIKGKQNRK